MAQFRIDRAGSIPLRAGAQTANASPIWRGAGHRVVSVTLVAVAEDERKARANAGGTTDFNSPGRGFDSRRVQPHL